ncbi:hypothetical protein LguiA_020562 [Lonicera macranthoides]
MNSLVNHAKSPTTEEFSSKVEESESKNVILDNSNNGSNKNNHVAKEKGPPKPSLFVKVNMDGTLIGRKVDLNAHRCYDTLTRTLDEMFCRRSSIEENGVTTKEMAPSKLLDGSSEFVLTYEDKDGDWMLVGDVPWRMFLNSVKRLRIMRTSEANGLAPSFQERKGRQRTKAV